MREPRDKQAGVNGNEWERQGCWGPHPAFGHPLPEGEGLDWDGSHRPSATLSQRERGFDTACFAGMTELGRHRNFVLMTDSGGGGL